MKKLLFIILAIVSLIIILPLSFKNSQIITFDYIFGQYQLPLSWLIFAALIVGVFITLPFFAFTGWLWKLKAKRLQNILDNIEKQEKQNKVTEQFYQEQQDN